LDHAGITVNKNAIPYDPQKPMIASGIRIGTPAITTRGLKERDMPKVAKWIHDAIGHREDAAAIAKIRKEVKALCLKHPMYTERLRA
jgi:glycine hydroxymethyltransferase